uniref:Glutathione S-transferase omega-like 2-like n=1 Tax=Saccoglossus kowalevskii TaxID=10224 RepID=A0ABM0GXD8_SACKO|nr:PREDICTED: glutathione S-transferase omega-like 2-like [Saccoglossus kowalevskii]
MTSNNGDMTNSWTSSVSEKGEYVRKTTTFRKTVTADGSSGFKAEADRYHLYVSLACPWAHRTLIGRKLKGLEEVLPYTVVDWLLGPGGWNFTDKKPKCSLDTVNNAKFLKEIYKKADADYEGNITVPVLWDKKTSTIVNNESAEILRMLNTEFNEFCATDKQKKIDFYPKDLQGKIDELNDWIFPKINNGVYRAGFATKQAAYDTAVHELFEALDKVEDILSKNRYLTGDQLTEADIRLFTTLVRFDTVYVGHFKCNKKRILDYPNMWGFVRDIYQTGCIAETVDQEHIQNHYQQSHKSINPSGIVAIGPDLDFDAPHGLGK